MPNIVFQSDYGTSNGIAQLYGVCKSVDINLHLYDLSHNIPHFDMAAAANNLADTVANWPANTVFVSLVDPLTGTDHTIVCAKTTSNNYILSADNDTIKILEEKGLIVYKKDITAFVKEYADKQPTKLLHGRDLAYVAANLTLGNYTLK